MDYSRIYAAFIADRRNKEVDTLLSNDYTEKHHITPRAKGGDDTVGNLIHLTPEDHFFAHLLLAKIHGGEMWAPIAFMVGGSRKDYKPTHSRKAHGWAARALSKAKRGEGAYQFDHTEYDLVHRDGREVKRLQSRFAELGISKSLANMLIKGRVSEAKGWALKGAERKTPVGAKHPMYRPEVHEFRHVNGAAFVGTQFEFSEQMRLGRPAVSCLVNGSRRVTKGWYMAVAGFPELKTGARWAKLLQS